MSDNFTLAGSWSASPAFGSPSGIASFCTPLEESLSLTAKDYDTIPLLADAAVPVSFGGGVTNATVVILKATGGKVRARLTSTDGAVQAIPFDDLLILISRTVPITAIDLTRTTGVSTTVDVFIGSTT